MAEPLFIIITLLFILQKELFKNNNSNYEISNKKDLHIYINIYIIYA